MTHLFSEVGPELIQFWLHDLRVIGCVHEILPHPLGDGYLHSVVSCCYGFHVPLDCGVLEHTFEVVDERDEEKANENSHASDEETLNLPIDQVFVIQCARDLNEEIRFHQTIFDQSLVTDGFSHSISIFDLRDIEDTFFQAITSWLEETEYIFLFQKREAFLRILVIHAEILRWRRFWNNSKFAEICA